MNQVAVLQHLRKPEALLEVRIAPAVGDVHVVDAREAAADAARLVDGEEGLPRPLLVDGVAGGAVGVVVALDDLGPQHVAAAGDPEAGALVEGLLVGGRPRVVGRVAVVRLVVLPVEHLGSDARRRLLVCVAAPVHERKTEVNITLLVARQAA